MTDQTPAQQLAALDELIRARAAAQLEDGEQVVNWLVIAGTRMFRPDPDLPGGTAGTVIAIPHMGAMPPWEAKGIIGHYLNLIGGPYENDDRGDQ